MHRFRRPSAVLVLGALLAASLGSLWFVQRAAAPFSCWSSGDQTWSGVIVVGESSQCDWYGVSPAHTLTIQPGTQVQFLNTNSSLFIAGRLNALGTTASPIEFTASSGSPRPMDYDIGIYFNETASPDSIVQNITIHYATTGIFLEPFSYARLDRVTLTNNCEGIEMWGATARIENSTIRANNCTDVGGIGLYLAWSSPTVYAVNVSDHNSQGFFITGNLSRPTIVNSDIFQNGYEGIRAVGRSAPTILSSRIRYNGAQSGGSGIAIFNAGGYVANNDITSNGKHDCALSPTCEGQANAGVYADYRTFPVIENNFIAYNRHNGIAVYQDSNVIIRGNNFTGNDRVNAPGHNYPSIVLNETAGKVENNVIVGDGGDGIYATNVLDSLLIANNTIVAGDEADTGTDPPQAAEASGIYLRSVWDAVVRNNTVRGGGGGDGYRLGGDGGPAVRTEFGSFLFEDNNLTGGPGGNPTSVDPPPGTATVGGRGGPALNAYRSEVVMRRGRFEGGTGGLGPPTGLAPKYYQGGDGGHALILRNTTVNATAANSWIKGGEQGLPIQLPASVFGVPGRAFYLRERARALAVNVTVAPVATQAGTYKHADVAQDSQLTLRNASFDKTKLSTSDTSWIQIEWFLHVRVLDNNNQPMNGASVETRNKVGILIDDGPTAPGPPPYPVAGPPGPSSGEGYRRWIIAAEVRKLSGVPTQVDYTPHNVTATKAGSVCWQNVTVDRSKAINCVLATDLSPPRVVNIQPPRYGSGVGPGQTIRVTFSRAMNLTSVETAFRIEPFVAGSFSWAGNDTLIFTPSPALDCSTHYVVTIMWTATGAAGQTLDGNGNFMSENSSADNYQSSFTTIMCQDTTYPCVIDYLPKGIANATDDIVIVFSEAMNVNSVWNALFVNPPLLNLGAYPVWDGSTLIVKHLLPLDTVLYNVTIYPFATDTQGNPLDGDCNGSGGLPEDIFSWNFTVVPDTSPPRVVSVSPANGATGVLIDTIVNITFTKPMDGLSVRNAFSAPFAIGSWSSNANGTTVFLQPASYLGFNQLYPITLSGSAKDIYNVTLDGDGDNVSEGPGIDDYSWSFRTMVQEFIPPQVLWTVPPNLAIDVDVDTEIWIAFSEPMDKRTMAGNITLNPPEPAPFETRWEGNAYVLALPRDVYYQFFTTINVTVADAVRDLSGNAMVAPYQFNFTTKDIEFMPPTVTQTDPYNGESGVAVDRPIIVWFSEHMNRTSVENSLHISFGRTSWNPPLPGIWTWENASFIFQPFELLRVATRYTVRLDETAMDLNRNRLDGNNDGAAGGDKVWYFTTYQPSPPPHVIATSPPNNSVDVPVDFQPITFTFDKPMNLESAQGSVIPSPDIGGVFMWNGTQELHFWPASNFTPSTTYRFTVLGRAQDASGITLDGNNDGLPGGNSDSFWFEFRTAGVVDTDPPNVISHFPTGTVPTTTEVWVTFNESMSQTSLSVLEAFRFVFNGTLSVAPQVTPDTSSVLLQNASDFPPCTTVTVVLNASVITDAAGNFLDGDNDEIAGGDYAWSFDTICSQTKWWPAALIDHFPQGSDVSVTTEIYVGFNETMDWNSVASNFSYEILGTVYTVANGTWWPVANYFHFDPIPDLPCNVAVNVTLGPAADPSGIPFAGFAWSFSTEVCVPPTVIDWSPVGIDVSIYDAIRFEFSRSMDWSSFPPAFSYRDAAGTTFILPDDAISVPIDDKNVAVYPNSLRYCTDYTVTLNGSVMDTQGLSVGQDLTFSFTTNCLPTVVGFGPVGSSVAIDTTLYVVFSEPMDDADINVSGTPLFMLSWDGSRTNVTVTFQSSLEYGVNYMIRVRSGGTRDLTFLPLDGNGNQEWEGSPDDDFVWSFATVGPSRWTAYSPQGLNVPITSTIRVDFSKPMDEASTLAGLSITSNPLLSYTWTMSLDRRSLTLIPLGPLPYGTRYDVFLNGSIALSQEGLAFDGDADGIPGGDLQWSFWTDFLPYVSSENPSPGSQGLPSDTDPEIEFNEPMDQASVETSLTVVGPSGPLPPGDVTFAWLSPSILRVDLPPLLYGAIYSLQITTGALDLAGLPLDGNENQEIDGSPVDDYVLVFRIDIAPVVVGTLPPSGGVLAGPTDPIRITFSEDMDVSTGQAVVTVVANGTVHPVFSAWQDTDLGTDLVLYPIQPLAYNTMYQVRVLGTATDLQGSPLDGDGDGLVEGSPTDDYVFTFSVREQDLTPPTVIRTSPVDDTRQVDPKTIILIVFSEPMNASTTEFGFQIAWGNITWRVFGHTGEWPFEWQNGTRELLFDPAKAFGGLETDVAYTVRIAGSSRDLEGNRFDGNYDGIGGDAYAFRFVTLDTVPPEVEITEPEDGARFPVQSVIRVRGIVREELGLQAVRGLLLQIGNGEWIDITSSYNATDGTWYYDWDTAGLPAGDYTVKVRAVDYGDSQSVDSVRIVLEDPSGWVWWVLLAALAAGIALLLFFLWWRRRKKEDEEPPAGESAAPADEVKPPEGDVGAPGEGVAPESEPPPGT